MPNGCVDDNFMDLKFSEEQKSRLDEVAATHGVTPKVFCEKILAEILHDLKYMNKEGIQLKTKEDRRARIKEVSQRAVERMLKGV